ncbi:MAG: hypothetical protein OEZ57_04705 [Nitrospirota bacterium]|nr:hypothetical protein [Nitrospirota bacterium]MDH5587236.1 hypothetical protein [Nitrospirota bacterium]MDH5774196.1 hypothetical protein [Nitrospirota bacterium]
MNAILSTLSAITQRLGHVASIVLSTLLIIFGCLVIVNPALLGWIVGLALILVGVAVLAGVFAPK